MKRIQTGEREVCKWIDEALEMYEYITSEERYPRRIQWAIPGILLLPYGSQANMKRFLHVNTAIENSKREQSRFRTRIAKGRVGNDS